MSDPIKSGEGAAGAGATVAGAVDDPAGPVVELAADRMPGLVEGFLRARGFDLEAPAPGVWLGRRPRADADGAPIGSELSATLVAGPDGAPIDWALEAAATARAAGVEGRLPLVTLTKRGLGPAESRRLSEAGVSALYPLQFFDWYFRRAQDDGGDGGEGAAPNRFDQVLRDVIEAARTPARAPQPYRRLLSLDPADRAARAEGGDLLSELLCALAGFPDRAGLTVICGPAGVGKSVLIGELLKARQDLFNAAKRRPAAIASRPLLFEPTELGAVMPETVDDLVERLFASKLGAHVPAAAFRWLAEAGLATWIFDGLDEFYRRQNDFFPMLEALLDAPESRAQIVICTRDSLLSSSAELIAFLERRLASDPDGVAIYELMRWDRNAKRAFVERVLTLDGVKDAALERRAAELMGAIEADTTLASLTDLPFYCDLFVRALQEGGGQDLRDEFGLLRFAVDELIARESGKLSIDWDVFVSDADLEAVRALAADAEARGLGTAGANPFAEALRAHGQDNLEFLIGGAAHFYRFAAVDGRGLHQISVAEWAEVLSPAFIDASLDEAEEEKVRLALLQFAFFSQGEARGEQGDSMSFTHDLIADYLAARYAWSLVEAGPGRPETWRQAFGGRRDVEDTVLFRYFAAQLRETPAVRDAARPALVGDRLEPHQRAALLRLLDER
ncbi:MAG: hypothetical protein AAFW46_08065 [Pseudomonadota bacterium]